MDSAHKSVAKTLPQEFDPETVTQIRKKLDSVRGEGLTVLFAIESGSRAWGFPSPDSDYDCRFVYLRPVRDHIVLKQQRDVIEFPIEGDLDVSGWDLRKALLLALNGNAVIHEWVDSPLVYEEIPSVRLALKELFSKILPPGKVAHHYAGHARGQMKILSASGELVSLKKVFYILRPLVALEWMRERNFSQLPPMNLNDCLAQTNIAPDIRQAVTDLIASKRRTREMGSGQPPEAVLRFIEAHAAKLNEPFPVMELSGEQKNCQRTKVESFYQEIVMRLGKPE